MVINCYPLYWMEKNELEVENHCVPTLVKVRGVPPFTQLCQSYKELGQWWDGLIIRVPAPFLGWEITPPIPLFYYFVTRATL